MNTNTRTHEHAKRIYVIQTTNDTTRIIVSNTMQNAKRKLYKQTHEHATRIDDIGLCKT